jgi:hypothetical protein
MGFFNGPSLMSHKIWLRKANVYDFSKNKIMTFLTLCMSTVTFPKGVKNIYGSMTAINWPLTGRIWKGRERLWRLVIAQGGLSLRGVRSDVYGKISK